MNKVKFLQKGVKRATPLFFNFGLAFIYSVLLSRFMTVSDRGELYEYQIIALLCGSFSSMSIPQAVTVSIKQDKRINFSFFISYLISGFALSALFSWLMISLWYPEKSFIFLFLMSYGTMLTIGFMEFFKINKDFKSFSTAYAMIPVVGFGVALLLMFGVQASLFNALLLWICFQLIIFFVFLRLFVREYELVKDEDALSFKDRSFLLTSIKLLGLKTIGALSQNIDKLTFSAVATPATSGLYAVCMSLESISTRSFRFMADYLYSQYINHDKKLTRPVLQVSVLALIIGVIGVGISYLLGKFLIVLLFGAKFIEAAIFLPIIIVNSVLSGWVLMLTQLNLSEKRFKFIYFRQLSGLFLFLLLVYVVFQPSTPMTIIQSALIVSFFKLVISVIECIYSSNKLKSIK